jgi:hypothetical protein
VLGQEVPRHGQLGLQGVATDGDGCCAHGAPPSFLN